MSTETEIKLAVVDSALDPETARRALSHWTGSAPRTSALQNTYYDTPDHALCAQRAALRLRRDGDRWIQAVKTGGSGTQGLHTRGEYELDAPEGTLDLDRLAAACPLPFLADRALCDRLAPVFTTNFTRTTWAYEPQPGTRVEVAYDVGEVRADSRYEALHEVELELQGGETTALFELAASVAKRLSVVPEDRSKAERGYALRDDRARAPVNAAPSSIDRKMTIEEVVATVAQDALTQFQRNLPAVLDGEDPEGVHQARVAMRRLRGMFRLCRDYIPRTLSRPALAPLRDVCAPLGAARDWDVLLLRLAEADHDHPLHPVLVESVRERRNAAYAGLHNRLRSPACGQALLSLRAWIATRGWRDALSPDARKALTCPSRRAAHKFLSAADRRIRRKARRFGRKTEAELHALRLEVKRLRYTVDCFAPLFPGKRTERYRRAARRLQNRLGECNDCTVGDRLIHELPARRGLQQGAQDLLGATSGQPKRCRRRAHAAWRKLRNCKPFWGSGRKP